MSRPEVSRPNGVPRSVLVVTIVHRPRDARISHRQIGALQAAGWQVTYAAPWSATGDRPGEGYATIDLPRAVGRRRLGAIRAARRALREQGPRHDVVLLHDPELLLAVLGLPLRAVVWDVHEDPAAALSDRDWVPNWARGVLRLGVRLLEGFAERRCAALLLAEDGYRDRFRHAHPVVPNVPLVPDEVPRPGTDRVVYVGRLSASRGARELVELGARLAGTATVELVGYVDDDVAALVQRAHADGQVRWHGFLPNDQAMQRLRGAAFGLSLLHDEPNYRHSMPTKVLEYLANGLPVITTPLPEAVAVLERHGLGTVVGFGDVDAVEAAVRAGVAEPEQLALRGRAAHAAARVERTWATEGPRFVEVLAAVADGAR